MTYSFTKTSFDRIYNQSATSYDAKKARYIHNFNNGDVGEDILDAFGDSYDPNSIYKPIEILSFVQKLQDKNCWLARGLYKKLISPDWDNGVDQTERLREEFGFSCEEEHVGDQLDTEFNYLFTLTSIMMNTPDENGNVYDWDWSFHYFNPSQFDENSKQWVNANKADSWSDAQVEMEAIVEHLNVMKPMRLRERLKDALAQTNYENAS